MRRRPCASAKPMPLHLAGLFWPILICRPGSQSAHRSTRRMQRRFTRRGPLGTQTIRRLQGDRRAVPLSPEPPQALSQGSSLHNSGEIAGAVLHVFRFPGSGILPFPHGGVLFPRRFHTYNANSRVLVPENHVILDFERGILPMAVRDNKSLGRL